MSGLDLEPQFNKPYLATSIHDFWGARWNLAVSGILRPTVYETNGSSVLCPWVELVSCTCCLRHVCCLKVDAWPHLLLHGMVDTGLEGKVMWFFLVHGLCTTVEIAVKKKSAGGSYWRDQEHHCISTLILTMIPNLENFILLRNISRSWLHMWLFFSFFLLLQLFQSFCNSITCMKTWTKKIVEVYKTIYKT